PRILEHEPGEFESIRGSRARERNGGSGETRQCKIARRRLNPRRESMKSLRIAFLVVLALVATIAMAQSEAQKTFEKLKSLDGMWEGKDRQGKDVKVSYRTT